MNLPYAAIFFGTFHDFSVLHHDFCMLRIGSVAGAMRHRQPRQAALLNTLFWPFPDSSRIQNFTIIPTQTAPRLLLSTYRSLGA